jgi:hypothetical protein
MAKMARRVRFADTFLEESFMESYSDEQDDSSPAYDDESSGISDRNLTYPSNTRNDNAKERSGCLAEMYLKKAYEAIILASLINADSNAWDGTVSKVL